MIRKFFLKFCFNSLCSDVVPSSPIFITVFHCVAWTMLNHDILEIKKSWSAALSTVQSINVHHVEPKKSKKNPQNLVTKITINEIKFSKNKQVKMKLHCQSYRIRDNDNESKDKDEDKHEYEYEDKHDDK